MTDAMVDVSHLRKTFVDESGEFDVLKDVGFTVDKGEMIALLGVSGAGKTTLLQILGGLDRSSGGEVTIEGRKLSSMSPAELAEFRNEKVGFVFQFHHLLPDFSALENVLIPGLIANKSRKVCEEKAKRLLMTFGLEKRFSHYPTELSGGERQRVALARALVNDPALVLADEPTGNLDRKNGELLLEFFCKANRELQQTFIIATHNSQLTDGLHRIITLEDGRVA
ncbi:MAG: ABC transporter ATP-binding protein [Chitinispirillaceae bacterium]|jgi:lipoprotein-releasing system ATP-binding protein|nr:ABC transporter ATP-binding protein [Chitinispirillaceae bacterium]